MILPEETHIIRRQLLELKFPRKAPGFEWQHLFSQYHHAHLVGLLEKACDEVCPEGMVLQLDKIEIDLGELSVTDLEKGKCNDAVYAVLIASLRKYVLPVLQNNGRLSSNYIQKKHQPIAWQWVYYMEHGYLPWNTLKVDEQWYADVLEALVADAGLTRALKEKILHSPTFLSRVVSEHRELFLSKLVEVLTGASQQELPTIVQDLVVLMSEIRRQPASAGKMETLKMWRTILQLAARHTATKGMTPVRLAALVIRERVLPYTAIDLSIPVPQSLHAVVLQELAEKQRTIHFQKDIDNDNNKNLINTTAETTENKSEHIDENTIPADGIYPHHAGLVLLHPFLPVFFKKCGLVENNTFQDINAQEKAMYLLYYLATGIGHHEPPEFALVIPKLLCGWPLEKPLLQESVLSADDMTAADELLEAVIENWEKLQNSSITALRESFLNRSGKVYMHNDLIYLQIEQHPLDILLDYLPWGISHIKLPWMPSLLRVEWR